MTPQCWRPSPQVRRVFLMRRPSWRCLSLPPLEEGETFSRFEIVHEVVCWADGEIDLAPETMYKMSYAYEKTA